VSTMTLFSGRLPLRSLRLSIAWTSAAGSRGF
jgi:hypothetical protein